jgi:hypothetical protein
MYVIAKSMALFWTLAEGLILISMRWGYLTLKRGQGNQKRFVAICVTLFVCFVFLMLGGEAAFRGFEDFNRRMNLSLYRWVLWNFFCTLWVLLEGMIMVYVYRIYRRLKPCPGDRRQERTSTRCNKKGLGLPEFRFGPIILLVLLLGVFLSYAGGLVSVTHRYSLGFVEIDRISLFYIRICGMFWIIFEWVVLVLGIKTYFIIKRSGGGFREGD